MDPPQFHIAKPIFEGAQNSVITCQVNGCEWSFAGMRSLLQPAWNEHYRMNHSQEVGTLLINKQLRESLWLPGSR